MVILSLLLAAPMLHAQNMTANYDESKMPAYTLPDPLVTTEGIKIVTSKAWETVQRPRIYKLFEENVYGRFPLKKIPVKTSVVETDPAALGGIAVRKQVRLEWPDAPGSYLDLLIYLPAATKKPVPVFMGYNFYGNHTVMPDPGIALSRSWVQSNGKGVLNNAATEASRGTDTSQWQVRQILAAGYGLVTAYYSDIEADRADGWKTGIRTTLKDALQIQPEEWCAIGAWAWGLSRMMDYVQTDKAIDAKKVALIGHSRLGKTALWAAASDPRFSIVVSNESGEGGAALSKRWYGETLGIITTKFPHWFVAKYKTYSDKTELLPLDQHMLLSLIAPRPLYVASAEGDQWSDPHGEFLSAQQAGSVYALYGKKGVGEGQMPGVHQPVGSTIRYHIRAGRHDVTLYDWQQYLAFAASNWQKR
ncbi:MAG: acetylxylan esterase [Bacteroidota bacterium]|nr:acetylxylan esterase [Bacteroidota bacterium]